jgi:hypothetical protein
VGVKDGAGNIKIIKSGWGEKTKELAIKSYKRGIIRNINMMLSWEAKDLRSPTFISLNNDVKVVNAMLEDLKKEQSERKASYVLASVVK